jgi:hypothetical protein
MGRESGESDAIGSRRTLIPETREESLSVKKTLFRVADRRPAARLREPASATVCDPGRKRSRRFWR